MTKPKLTAALRKALERAGAWESLPDDERTRAAKKKWEARQEREAKKAAEAKAKAVEAKKTAKTTGAAKKKPTKKTAAKKGRSATAVSDDPDLFVQDGHITSRHATLPDLMPLAKKGIVGLHTERKLKRAPGLAAFLDACPSLREVYLHDPKLLDPAPAKATVRELTISGASIASLEFLKGFPQLEILRLGNAAPKLTSLEGLRHVPKLRRLRAHQHGASSLAPLGSLKQLREYVAPTTKRLRSLDGLQDCPQLRHIDVNLVPIADLAPLSKSKQLVALKVRGSHVTTLEPLHGHNKLQTLFVERSKLRSIEGIARGLPALRLLWIHSTSVDDLGPLRGLKHLLSLNLGGLRVTDFSVLGELRSLRRLDLCDTSFDDLDLLASLPNLVSVRVEGTRVKKNDPRVKKLNATLEKRGREPGVHFKARWGARVLLEHDRAPFVEYSDDAEDYSVTFLK